MTSGSRRSRNYKEKRPMLAFGQIVLPIAALIAVGLLFVGIKLFFLTPPDRGGVEVIAQAENPQALPLEGDDPGEEPNNTTPVNDEATQQEQKSQPKEKIILAGPVDPGRPTSSTTKSEVKPADTKPQTAKPTTNTTANTQQTVKPAAKPTAAVQTSTKQPQTAATQTTAAAKWVVQIGAFSKEEGAKTLADQAKKEGYSTSISTTNSSSGTKFYRVRVNAGDTREKADKLAVELEKKGYPVSVFPSQ